MAFMSVSVFMGFGVAAEMSRGTGWMLAVAQLGRLLDSGLGALSMFSPVFVWVKQQDVWNKGKAIVGGALILSKDQVVTAVSSTIPELIIEKDEHVRVVASTPIVICEKCELQVSKELYKLVNVKGKEYYYCRTCQCNYNNDPENFKPSENEFVPCWEVISLGHVGAWVKICNKCKEESDMLYSCACKDCDQLAVCYGCYDCKVTKLIKAEKVASVLMAGALAAGAVYGVTQIVRWARQTRPGKFVKSVKDQACVHRPFDAKSLLKLVSANSTGGWTEGTGFVCKNFVVTVGHVVPTLLEEFKGLGRESGVHRSFEKGELTPLSVEISTVNGVVNVELYIHHYVEIKTNNVMVNDVLVFLSTLTKSEKYGPVIGTSFKLTNWEVNGDGKMAKGDEVCETLRFQSDEDNICYADYTIEDSLIQTDGVTHQGTSGGPYFLEGSDQVVGVHVSGDAQTVSYALLLKPEYFLSEDGTRGHANRPWGGIGSHDPYPEIESKVKEILDQAKGKVKRGRGAKHGKFGMHAQRMRRYAKFNGKWYEMRKNPDTGEYEWVQIEREKAERDMEEGRAVDYFSEERNERNREAAQASLEAAYAGYDMSQIGRNLIDQYEARLEEINRRGYDSDASDLSDYDPDTWKYRRGGERWQARKVHFTSGPPQPGPSETKVVIPRLAIEEATTSEPQKKKNKPGKKMREKLRAKLQKLDRPEGTEVKSSDTKTPPKSSTKKDSKPTLHTGDSSPVRGRQRTRSKESRD
jgi:hypothetical protein